MPWTQSARGRGGAFMPLSIRHRTLRASDRRLRQRPKSGGDGANPGRQDASPTLSFGPPTPTPMGCSGLSAPQSGRQHYHSSSGISGGSCTRLPGFSWFFFSFVVSGQWLFAPPPPTHPPTHSCVVQPHRMRWGIRICQKTTEHFEGPSEPPFLDGPSELLEESPDPFIAAGLVAIPIPVQPAFACQLYLIYFVSIQALQSK